MYYTQDKVSFQVKIILSFFFFFFAKWKLTLTLTFAEEFLSPFQVFDLHLFVTYFFHNIK